MTNMDCETKLRIMNERTIINYSTAGGQGPWGDRGDTVFKPTEGTRRHGGFWVAFDFQIFDINIFT
jgi:hypothetical protein